MDTRLETFAVAIGPAAVQELLDNFEDLVQFAATEGEAGKLTLSIAAKPSSAIHGKVFLEALTTIKRPKERPEPHDGQVFVVEGVLTTIDPQGSLFERGER